MYVLTAIRNLSGMNSMFETSIGEFLWIALQYIFYICYTGVEILSFIAIIYTICLVFVGWKKPKRDYAFQAPRKRFLIFIPAHNEEMVVEHIVHNLLHTVNYPPELLGIYVIADNCTDDTAFRARQAGANVIEHFSAPDEPKGKPHGIKYALDILGDTISSYDYMAIFDADNLISAEYFNEMNSQLLADPEIKVSQGYLDVKNIASSKVSLGYSLAYYESNRFFCHSRNKLNLAPVIGGTGFVMDIPVLQEIGWTVDSLTEDLELQMQCVLHGHKIVWNHFATIYDEKPTQYKQSIVQRVRWARGHWTVKRKYFRPLLKKIWSQLKQKRRLDYTSLDAALYAVMPFSTGVAPLVILIKLILTDNVLGVGATLLVYFVLRTLVSLILVQYALKDDSTQTLTGGYINMMLGMIWYMVSGMGIYCYGILTYTKNIWVRTEHNVETDLGDLLMQIEK